MKITEKRLEELTPYENNPRRNETAIEFVKNSIKEFGFKVPIVIDRYGVIVAGHTRYLAAQELGMTSLPCVVADDLTPQQIKAFRIADNSTAAVAEWDFDILADEIADLPEFTFSDFGLDFSGELDDTETEENEIPYISPGTPTAKPGDIWQLGRHRLACGDTTDPETLERLLGGVVVDLIQTDPPYNVDYGSKAESINKYGDHFSDRHIENDAMNDEAFADFLCDSFRNMFEHLKDGGAFYIWHASTTIYEFESALRANGIQTRQQLIWNKNALVLGRQDYQWKHEPCLYGWKDGAAHYFVDDRTQTTVLDEDKPSRSEEHPTMKPVKLTARLIKNSTRPGESVLDGFGGSGTTLITCEQIDRVCYMVEYDPKYVDVIIKRWEQLTGGKAVLIDEAL